MSGSKARHSTLKACATSPGRSGGLVYGPLLKGKQARRILFVTLICLVWFPDSQRLAGETVTLLRVESEGACPALWQTPLGQFWGRVDDKRPLENQIQEQLTEEVYQNSTVRVSQGDVVLDVGSNLGTFTRHALKNGARIVVAFEVAPTTITCFKRNFEKEILENRVILVKAAAWRSEGTVRFKLGRHSGMSRVTPKGDFEVPATTIDRVVTDIGLKRVDFIKMDIEGAERHALAGARQTLARFHPRMALCIYHRRDDPEVIPRIALEAYPDYKVKTNGAQAYFF